jgi:uncharacterized membrane protein YphA (DoxX/SURF4 family)
MNYNQLVNPGRIIFAIGIIALGIMQFFIKDFILARPSSPTWSADIPGKTLWAWVSGASVAIAGLAVIFRKKGAWAALFIAAIFFAGAFLLRNFPTMIIEPDLKSAILFHINAFKSLGFTGGGLIVAASFFKAEGRNRKPAFNNAGLILLGIIFLSVFFIICGWAHFEFSSFVVELIPSYIPAREFWTYFSAVALIAGGVGLLFPFTRKWAALLLGIMILLWFFLLHIPRAVTMDANEEWMGVFESFSFSGLCFVLAGLYSRK